PITVRLLSSLPTRRPPSSTLFPYTTLFRSRHGSRRALRSTRRAVVQGTGRSPRETPVLACPLLAATTSRQAIRVQVRCHGRRRGDRKSTRLNSSHRTISYAVFCLKKKKSKT